MMGRNVSVSAVVLIAFEVHHSSDASGETGLLADGVCYVVWLKLAGLPTKQGQFCSLPPGGHNFRLYLK